MKALETRTLYSRYFLTPFQLGMKNFAVHLRRVRPVSVAVRHRIRPTSVVFRRRMHPTFVTGRRRRLAAPAYASPLLQEFRREGFARFSSWWCSFRSRKGEKTDLRYTVTCALSAVKMRGAPPSPTGSGNMNASGSGNNNAGGGPRYRHRKRTSSDESRGNGWFRIPRPALSIPLMMKKQSSSRDESKAGGDKETTVEDETAKKYRSMWIRTLSSIWMIGGFVLIVYMGHLYIWAMIVVIQLYMAQELFTLARAAQREKQLPGFRLLNWHFFLTAMLYVYGRFLNKHLVKTIRSDHLIPHLFKYGLIKYHMLICYSLYIAGFVWFILTLKRGLYKYQFGQFAWTHMILFVVFAQSSFTVANIFEGIIWFLLPASLIVINDIMAYFFGVFFGKTPLIKLSPKKTWEGFIGASFSTVLSAFMLAYIMGQSEWLTCPRKDLSTGWLHCDPGPLFRPIYHPLPTWTPQWFPWKEFGVMPVQTHAMAFGLFASLVAPFGGFFASGFKRAFNIKDFGDSIPGHGGITDRMDCQMVMAVFSYIYYQSFISPHHYSIESFLDQILVNLSLEEQMGLYKQLGEALTRSQR